MNTKYIACLIIALAPTAAFAGDAPNKWQKDFSAFTSGFNSTFAENIEQSGGRYDGEKFKQSLDEMQRLCERARKACNDDNDKDACDALNSFVENKAIEDRVNHVAALVDKQGQGEADIRSPAGVKQAACGAINQIKQGKAIIAHERKVASVSGTQNIHNLNVAGNVVVQNEELLAYKKAEYKKLTHKEINLKDCE
jgi:hypothetical protein